MVAACHRTAALTTAILLSAIPLTPTPTDQTFGPDVLYAEGEFMGDLCNFGAVEIGEAGLLIVRIIDQAGVERYQVQHMPAQ
jgi:hypothetical protein